MSLVKVRPLQGALVLCALVALLDTACFRRRPFLRPNYNLPYRGSIQGVPPQAMLEAPPRPGGESYAAIVENDFVTVASRPLSTFSADVDTASYSNVRRMLNEG